MAVDDEDLLDDPLSDPDTDGEELEEEDPETVSLGVLDSLELWLPLSVAEGVDVSVDDSLREWEEERLLLSISDEDGLIVSDKVGEPLDVCVTVSVGVGVCKSEPLIELLTDGLADEEALFVGETLGLSLKECDGELLSLPDREFVWLLVSELLIVGDEVTVSLSV